MSTKNKNKDSNGSGGSAQPTKLGVQTSDPSSTEIVPQNQSMEALIAQAIDKGTPVETMERLLAMRRELKAEWAKEQFDKAMAKFQSECPTIRKTKEVYTNASNLAYRYAPIESIVEQVKEALQNNGFSYSTRQELKENGVKILVEVTHSAGHSKVTEMEVPFGSKTSVMSDSQVAAAASTFAKRYAFCNAFGILTGDEDTDGKSEDDNSKPNAPKSEAPKDDKKKKTGYEKVVAMIQVGTAEELKDYKSKIEKSEKYSEDDKANLCIMIDDRLKELKK